MQRHRRSLMGWLRANSEPDDPKRVDGKATGGSICPVCQGSTLQVANRAGISPRGGSVRVETLETCPRCRGTGVV